MYLGNLLESIFLKTIECCEMDYFQFGIKFRFRLYSFVLSLAKYAWLTDLLLREEKHLSLHKIFLVLGTEVCYFCIRVDTWQ